ncbi:MAG: amino acid ABC transporter ATP-binding protein [Caulobacter sp.]
MSVTEPSIVELVDVTKLFAGRPVLDRVSLQLRRGETIVLLGPSGAGKSTLIRCVSGLEPIYSGMIYVQGEPMGMTLTNGTWKPDDARTLARKRRQVGMVFQRFNLFPHMTAIENVMAGPVNVLGAAREEARAQAVELLEKVGLGDKLASYPAQLSGGQQQRVAIARSLAMNPAVLLFDEPTSALDPERVKDVVGIIRDLARQGMSMIVVSHEMGLAREAADRVVMMEAGRIVEDVPVAQIDTSPDAARVRRFMTAF